MLKDWGKGRDTRRWTLLQKHNTWEEYRDRLFTRQRIGMNWNENLGGTRELSVPRMIDVYFRMKYLMHLPSGDPRRIPETSETVSRIRRLHAVILQRAQENFGVASGMTEQDIVQLKAQGMEVDPKKVPQMTVTERLQLVHSYLTGGAEAYYGRRRETIEKIAEDAYRPIRRRVERNEKMRNFGKDVLYRNKWLSGRGIVASPFRAIGWTGGKILGGAKAAASAVNERKAGLLWGTAGGVLALGPAGLLIGPAIGWFLGKKKARSASSSSH
jgi:hypothetical protein